LLFERDPIYTWQERSNQGQSNALSLLKKSFYMKTIFNRLIALFCFCPTLIYSQYAVEAGQPSLLAGNNRSEYPVAVRNLSQPVSTWGDDLLKKEGGEKKYTPEEKRRILDKMSYPSYNLDRVWLQRVAVDYKFNGVNAPVDLTPALIERIPNVIDTISILAGKYGEFWTLYEAEHGIPETLDRLCRETRFGIHNNKGILFRYYEGDEYITKMEAMLSEAMTLAAKKVLNFELNTYKSSPNDYMNLFGWKDVDALVEKASVYLAVTKIKGIATSDKIEEMTAMKTEALSNIEPYRKEFEAKVDELEAKTLEAKGMPRERYKGADREQVRKKIIAANTGHCKEFKLAKVILTSPQWEKSVGSKFDSNSRTYSDYDESFMTIAIVLKNVDRPKIGYIIDELTITKDLIIKSTNYEIPMSFLCPNDIESIGQIQPILMKNIK
jgi:hypothetical protein